MPLRDAPMQCSRMPKWKLRPAYESRSKSPSPARFVSVDGARSAEPPKKLGTVLAIAFITLLDAMRVASGPSSGLKLGIPESQFFGSLAACSDVNADARSGNAAA